jgi:hypothetical protein
MGLTYLNFLWQKTFPKNPIARSISLLILVFCVLLASAYNLKAYFIAWPNSPSTFIVFNKKV